MKCHRCQTGIKHSKTHCPHCGAQLLPLPYKTISDTTNSKGERQRRSPVLTAVRIGLLGVLVVGLGIVVKMNSAQSNQNSTQTKIQVAKNSSLPENTAPTPMPSVEAAEIVLPKPAPIASASSSSMNSPSASRLEKAKPINNSAAIAPAPLPKAAQAAPSTAAETMQAFNMSQPSAPPKIEIVTPTPRVITTPRAPAITEPVTATLEVDSAPTELNAQTGLLTIKSYVPARIYIDGAYSGVTPRSVKLIAGEHTVTLVADGFQEWTRKVKLNGKEQAGILASLKKPSISQP